MATITIRNLSEEVIRKLRLRAAQHERSMETEARAILAREMEEPQGESKRNAGGTSGSAACGARSPVRGLWKGRRSTDEVMAITRGDE